MPNRTILLTGAAGFIGSHVTQALLARGDRVIGLDNLDPFYPETLKRQNLEAIAATDTQGAFTFEHADIRDEPAVRSIYKIHKPTSTIHLAAKAGVRPSIQDPAGYADVNLVGSSVMIEAARQAHQDGAFVLASSSSVYGNNKKVPFAETDPIERPISPYASTKRAAELITSTFSELYNLPVACLRFFTVFGPRQRPDLAIAKFIKLIQNGEPIPVFGDGSTSRDYTFINDIVQGVISAHDRIPDHGYRIWNLGSDRPITLTEMIETIARVLETDPVIDRQPMQPGDVDRTYADITRARAELDYAPTTTFEDGVRQQANALSLNPR